MLIRALFLGLFILQHACCAAESTGKGGGGAAESTGSGDGGATAARVKVGTTKRVSKRAIIAEPESEATGSEPESEATSAEPEVSSAEIPSQPEGNHVTRTTEPEHSATSENNSSIQMRQVESDDDDELTNMQILLPPLALVFIIIGGLITLSVYNQRSCVKALPCYRHKIHPLTRSNNLAIKKSKARSTDIEMLTSSVDINESMISEFTDEDVEILTDFDREVITYLDHFYNKPSELFHIALPGLVSLLLCPFALYLFDPLAKIFWPVHLYPKPPNINDAIACFLAPAGLVYAMAFGYAFQSALSKQNEIYGRITYELSQIDQIVTFTTKLTFPNKQVALDILRAVKCEAIFMALQISDAEPDDFEHYNKDDKNVKVQIWTILDDLKKLTPRAVDEFDGVVNRVLVEEIIEHIMELNSICSDRMGAWHTRIHPLKWMFLETLGFFSFFGVLLLTTKSYILELVMCVITVFSISLLCYVVSDFDSPFSGFFRVDLSVLKDVVMRIEAMYRLKTKDDATIWYYPAKKKDAESLCSKVICRSKTSDAK
ncbi:uncharacterized protein LOC141906352 [Tubulanus polymorphus]|uniref:uncharacterized protein LOC141906352 n=1 Tax=Tubulanus polymorphus TaxID=672921 RepID=UPI003DA2299B